MKKGGQCWYLVNSCAAGRVQLLGGRFQQAKASFVGLDNKLKSAALSGVTLTAGLRLSEVSDSARAKSIKPARGV